MFAPSNDEIMDPLGVAASLRWLQPPPQNMLEEALGLVREVFHFVRGLQLLVYCLVNGVGAHTRVAARQGLNGDRFGGQGVAVNQEKAKNMSSICFACCSCL